MMVMTLRSNPRFKRFATLFSVATAAVLVLTACGGGGDKATPTPTILPTQTAQAPIASPRPGETTVGMLADRIAAAWPKVTSMRQTTRTSETSPASATPSASPVAGLEAVLVTEVDSDGNKRIVVSAGGLNISELIAIRGQVWALGYELWNIPPDAVGEPFGDGWVEIDTSYGSVDANLNQLILQLMSPVPPMYSNLTAEERARVVEPLGERTIDGRTCQAYRIPDTTLTGQAYDTIVSLDDAGLPCQIETLALGSNRSDTFVFNEPITILPPSTTPSGSPVATPASGS